MHHFNCKDIQDRIILFFGQRTTLRREDMNEIYTIIRSIARVNCRNSDPYLRQAKLKSVLGYGDWGKRFRGDLNATFFFKPREWQIP